MSVVKRQTPPPWRPAPGLERRPVRPDAPVRLDSRAAARAARSRLGRASVQRWRVEGGFMEVRRLPGGGTHHRFIETGAAARAKPRAAKGPTPAKPTTRSAREY